MQEHKPALAIERHRSAVAAAGQGIPHQGVVLGQEPFQAVVRGVFNVEHKAAQVWFTLETTENLSMCLVPHASPLQQHVIDVEFPPFDSAEVLAVNLQKTAIEMAAAGGEPTLHAARVEDEVGVWVAVDQVLVQQSSFGEDVIATFSMLRHVNEIKKSVAAGVVRLKVDSAAAA